jgi:hypothetical protein
MLAKLIPPCTGSGEGRVATSEFPSCPAPLSPQQYAAPVVSITHEWKYPAADIETRIGFLTLKFWLVAEARPGDCATMASPAPALSILTSVNVALPSTG